MDGEEKMTQIGEMIRLATAADYPSDRLTGLETTIFTGPEFSDMVKLEELAIGESIPQGSLFAYLFRRFGHPNMSSDDYKELCRYILTTEHPEMLMSIVPYAGGNTSISISFHVPHAVAEACRQYPMRAREERDLAFLHWIESEGRLPENYEEIAAEARKQGWPVRADAPEWSAMMAPISYAAYQFKGKDDGSEPPEPVAWYNALAEEYERVNPTPADEYRSADWTQWDDEDPLKPFAAAIFETLEDLKRPVGIRDVDIDPWGEHDGSLSDRSVEASSSAGYPSGMLGNVDPKGFASLQSLVMRLAPDDHAEAIRIARGILAKELEGGAKAELETAE